MSNRRRKLTYFVIIAAVIAAFSILVLGLRLIRDDIRSITYRIKDYRGDGNISDDGFWSYPRYRISFAPVTASHTRSHQYRIEGLPPEPMTLTMRVVGHPADELLHDIGNHITVTISVKAEDDKVVYEYGGRLNDWVCSESVTKRAYWHPRLRDIDLWRYGKCRMVVDVKVDTEVGDSLVLEPQLSGGGNELP
jgi:hypothetical protein